MFLGLAPHRPFSCQAVAPMARHRGLGEPSWGPPRVSSRATQEISSGVCKPFWGQRLLHSPLFFGPLFNELSSFLPANLGAMSEAILLPNTGPKHDNNSTCLCLMAPRFALGCLFGSSLGAAFGGLLFFHSEHFETQKYTPKLGEQNRIEPNEVMCKFFQSARRTVITRLATLVPSL